MAVISNPAEIFPSVCRLLEELIAEEIGIARSLAAMAKEDRRQGLTNGKMHYL